MPINLWSGRSRQKIQPSFEITLANENPFRLVDSCTDNPIPIIILVVVVVVVVMVDIIMVSILIAMFLGRQVRSQWFGVSWVAYKFHVQVCRNLRVPKRVCRPVLR